MMVLLVPGLEAQGASSVPVVSRVEASVEKPGRSAGASKDRRRRRARSKVATRPPPKWTSPRSTAQLVSDISALLSSRVRRGRWGGIVVSLSRGDTLFAYNADGSMTPASNMKLFTAAIALDQFGPEHQFTTGVLRDGDLTADGTVDGNLVLQGDGDPAFSNRFLQGGPGAPVNLLAELVAGSGVRRVRGDLIADAAAFDDELIPEGWQTRYLNSSYAARVSALSLNENLVWVSVQPGKATREPARVSLDPSTIIPVASNVRTRSGSRTARVTIYTSATGTIEVRGWIGSRAGERRYQLVVEDPALYTAGAFRRALAERGIVVDGQIIKARAPASAVRIASLPSPSLDRLLSVMNRESVNHFAELIFRNASRTAAFDKPGSAAAGNWLLQRFLTEKVGVAPGAVFAADGSGLSVLNYATPRSLVQLLGYASRAPWSDAFHASLPVAGESETLRYRMRGSPAEGNLHAKTGTTNSVISLGGYVSAENGELLAFALFYNGTDRSNARMTIDAVGGTLAAFSRTPGDR
ncbi:MAG: D-alanyl-D-alanine carboxypeptidase/D-alanyl-D-alanine-endopeptidase [Gemmatimonadaceae bacterium]